MAALVFSASLLLIGASMIRLGWGRHGDYGLSFFHLEWLMELQRHTAHRANLAELALGLILLVSSLVLFYMAARRSEDVRA